MGLGIHEPILVAQTVPVNHKGIIELFKMLKIPVATVLIEVCLLGTVRSVTVVAVRDHSTYSTTAIVDVIFLVRENYFVIVVFTLLYTVVLVGSERHVGKRIMRGLLLLDQGGYGNH